MSNLQVWRPNQVYEIGTQIMYNNSLYRCLQKHKSYADWNPDTKPQYWRPETAYGAPVTSLKMAKR
jgi:chitodextrinase